MAEKLPRWLLNEKTKLREFQIKPDSLMILAEHGHITGDLYVFIFYFSLFSLLTYCGDINVYTNRDTLGKSVSASKNSVSVRL